MHILNMEMLCVFWTTIFTSDSSIPGYKMLLIRVDDNVFALDLEIGGYSTTSAFYLAQDWLPCG
jgi:hypothetical protein